MDLIVAVHVHSASIKRVDVYIFIGINYSTLSNL